MCIFKLLIVDESKLKRDYRSTTVVSRIAVDVNPGTRGTSVEDCNVSMTFRNLRHDAE